jgi:PAS domain-containing protein
MSTEQQWHDTHESELRLRVTLDSLSEGVILYARDGRVAMFNATAQRILGFDPGAGTVDEIVRQRRVVDGEGVPFDAASDHHQVRWEGAELDSRLVGLVGEDGNVQWLMTSLRPIATDRDEPP